MYILGTQLEQLCAAGRRNILLVAPFVKAHTLERLLGQVAAEVAVRCVTRWRPEEIVAGVSDLEVWPLLRDRVQSSLWLHPDLHAKFYRADDTCLIGSANITGTALGWSPNPNLELLIPIHAEHSIVQSFEEILSQECIQVDESLFQQMSQIVALIKQDSANLPRFVHEQRDVPYEIASSEPIVPASQWLPKLRQPADLYLAYTQRYDELTTVSRANAASDLQAVPVPPGLSRPAFEAYVGMLLLQKPILRQVDRFLTQPQRFGAVRDLLARLPCSTIPEFDPTHAWQTLMRWLLYFLPQRYTRIPSRHSEVLQRVSSNTAQSSAK
jgi:hypothetical protein